MKPYLILDITTLILVILGIGIFYNDLIHGNFSWIVTMYFVIIALAYFIVINIINGWAKRIFLDTAKKIGCDFIDSGNFALTHYIKCNDMEIKVNLRGSYTPGSLYIKFRGRFREADIKGNDNNSNKFRKMLQNLQKKYKIKVNDAYISTNIAEMIITKYPYNANTLSKIINDAREIVFKV